MYWIVLNIIEYWKYKKNETENDTDSDTEISSIDNGNRNVLRDVGKYVHSSREQTDPGMFT